MNVCPAFDNKVIYLAWSFWESPNNKILISLRKLWWCKKIKRTVLCSIYKRQFKRKWEASSLINPQSHLESVIILDRNRSYLSELQLRRILAHRILGLLSATKKWPGILASTTLLLRLILKVLNVLVFLVSLSRIGILFCQIIWLFWLFSQPLNLIICNLRYFNPNVRSKTLNNSYSQPRNIVQSTINFKFFFIHSAILLNYFFRQESILIFNCQLNIQYHTMETVS